ncbi:hypothetical protein [Amycolatopsis antarctica]|uniref:hypothetical protein n=1 Tax=Amycolatopsis antarctica TaxID=1854586 RepID=UPI001F0A77E5|nr:hypothetical protein [Amycolatopsis antarctica]
MAGIVTEVLAPWVVIILLSTAMSAKATGFHAWHTPLWALVVAVFSAGVPMAFIARGARRGTYDTHHVNNREARTVVFLVCLGSTAVGMVILLLGSAPWTMVVTTVAMLTTLVVTATVTAVAKWKISMHTAVSGGGVAMLACVYGPSALALAGLVALVGWSRVVLRDHTTGQVCAGAVAGFAASAVVFLALG